MQLHFLGTGAGLPSKRRNVTSIVLDLLAERGSCWMFDCGEGTQHQLLHSYVKLSKVDKLFVTHLHGDHIFGIPGMLSSRSFHASGALRPTPLTVYGPTGIARYISNSLEVSGTHLTYPLDIEEIEDDGNVVFEDKLLRVEARWLRHGIPSLGYRIEEKDRPGEFFPDRAKALGLAPGPLYAKLQAGDAVQNPDGRTIQPTEVLGPKRPGRTVTILGDTKPCPAILELARNADVLVHEATFSREDSELADSYNHSTTADATSVAQSCQVRHLILTHISARYGPEDLPALEEEARAIFPESQFAEDFLTVPIPTRD